MKYCVTLDVLTPSHYIRLKRLTRDRHSGQGTLTEGEGSVDLLVLTLYQLLFRLYWAFPYVSVPCSGSTVGIASDDKNIKV
jgi:hypothetical protein